MVLMIKRRTFMASPASTGGARKENSGHRERAEGER